MLYESPPPPGRKWGKLLSGCGIGGPTTVSEDERGRKSNIILMAHKEAGGQAGLRKRKEENDGLCPKGEGGGDQRAYFRHPLTV